MLGKLMKYDLRSGIRTFSLIWIGLALLGAINGYMIAYIKIPAFISTYGLQWAVFGFAYVVLNGYVIYSFDDAFRFIGNGTVFKYFSMTTVCMMVIAVIGLITGITMKETANRPLKGATPAASDIQEAKEILREHYDNVEQKIEDIDAEIEELQKKRSRLVDQHPRINE